MHSTRHSLFYCCLHLLFILLMVVAPGWSVQAHNVLFNQESEIDILLERMTPEERIGQLFLISFKGSSVKSDAPIYDLIANRHIGGVILSTANENLPDNPALPNLGVQQALTMTLQLQQVEWQASQNAQVDPISGQSRFPVFIPLFIGINQEGDGYPYDQILHGLTPLPNAMAIGATWKPELAAQVGNILGKELSILGINLFLGPSLDVLEVSPFKITSNLGTRTFGSDPFWVGEMARAYIRGVHQGSAGKVAVVAKHFPGHGGSDRLPEEEVATVRKSLEELQSFDLAPFFAVTGNAVSSEETADALLTSNIRYQGLQGNIRATTRPVSFDSQAFTLLMKLPALENWHKNGGLMVSDNLGSLAVRRFYDLTSQTFDARRVMLNAFLAGNDLLYNADFTSESEPDPYLAIVHTLDFFTQKYREDAAFAQRVDESVRRILSLKMRIYDSFTLETILPNPGDLSQLNQASQVTFEVARQSATLLSPSLSELEDTIPDPPDRNDRIVFITDARLAKPCSQCASFELLGSRALPDAVLRLYGSAAGGDILSKNIVAYTLVDLDSMLSSGARDTQLERDLLRAHWIVFAMLNYREDLPSFPTLSRFLAERPALFQQKRLIVFSFSAPYFLDATNISKLTAYYCLYSKAPPFIDVAAYLLFRELRPVGAPPVSVPGTDYDLNEALFPDPNQTINLELDRQETTIPVATGTLEPTPTLQFQTGDIIPVRTGVIVDHNGHPVPDGTPVTFIYSISSDTNILRQEAFTVGGVARTSFSVTGSGTLEIFAVSENARSISLKFNIPSPTGALPTDTPTPEPTVTPSPTEPPPTPPPPIIPTPEPPKPHAGIFDWMIALLISGLLAWGSYQLGALIGQVRWGVRSGFSAFIGGLLAYSFLALRIPESKSLIGGSISRAVFLTTLTGSIMGLLGAFSWKAISEYKRKRTPPQEE